MNEEERQVAQTEHTESRSEHEGSREEEQREPTVDERIESLFEQLADYKHQSQQSFALGRVINRGGVELAARFGSDKLLDALEEVLSRDSVDTTMLDVIVVLEPDKKRRKELLQEMADQVESDQRDFERGDKEEIHNLMIGTAHSLHARSISIATYQRSDELRGMFGGKLVDVVTGATRMLQTFEDSLTQLQHGFGEDLSRLRTELANNGDDLEATYLEQRREQNDLYEDLDRRKTELTRELLDEIEAIEDGIDLNAQQEATSLLGDLERVRDAGTKTTSGEEIVRSAIESFERRLNEIRDAAQAEKEARTKVLHEQIITIRNIGY